MRILAYSQLLESYRSLTLESLSAAFGVSVEFVDRQVVYFVPSIYIPHPNLSYYSTNSELSRFIASSRLHASIDKVHGIVSTTRPSLKNAQYEQVVRKGDL